MTKTIVIATIRPWNISACRKWKPPLGYHKVLITDKAELTYERLKKINPRYVFFPHWSWIIPPEIFENFECVVFHMTDLPFGRGGSPMQNLIVRGIYKTKISAIRVEAGLDTGPVYLKKSFDLSRGSAEELFHKMAPILFSMMTKIVGKQPKPRSQRGEPTVFPRRKPEDSRIPAGLSPRRLYDFIRMLDAPGYPAAFIEGDGVRAEFGRATMQGGVVTAHARFTLINQPSI
jgi:methionyl-tRNA formyltransferase